MLLPQNLSYIIYYINYHYPSAIEFQFFFLNSSLSDFDSVDIIPTDLIENIHFARKGNTVAVRFDKTSCLIDCFVIGTTVTIYENLTDL